jgi:hypothetical protein
MMSVLIFVLLIMLLAVAGTTTGCREACARRSGGERICTRSAGGCVFQAITSDDNPIAIRV